MPFYKREGASLLDAPLFVSGPGLDLTAENHAEHTYPVQGWYWFETLDAALAGIAAPSDSVTKRQALQALIIKGYDEQVETLLANIPGMQGKLARAEWQQSSIVERQRPLVLQMITALGLTESQADELFALAATL